jgi:hypothetical protein
MTDRFDLEQQIMNCWHIIDDVKILNEYVLESDLTKDQISNALLGLEEIYQMKFDKLFRTFEELVRNKTIGNSTFNGVDVT